MKKLWALLGVLLIPGLVGAGVYWQRRHALAVRLAEARAAVGTVAGAALLERLAAEQPGHAEVAFLLARQRRLEGNAGQTEAHLRRAAALGWPATAVERERLLALALTDFRRAGPLLETWLDGHPNDRDCLLALAGGYEGTGRLAKAEALAEAVLSRDPDDRAARYVRGKVRLKQLQVGEARQDLEQALAPGPEPCFAHAARLHLAVCLLDLGHFEDALRLFQRCRAEEPGNPKALYGVGRCARFLNRLDEASDAFRELLRVRPDHVETLLQAAYTAEERGRPAEALQLLERAEKQDSTWMEIPYQKAKLLNALGRKGPADRAQARYLEMREQWARRKPGASLEEIFHPRTGPAFPKDLLDN